MKIKRFNMIEIVISLMIILVVFISVMGVFPSSVESSKETIDISNTSDSLSQLTNFVEQSVNENVDFLKAIPEDKTSITADENLLWNSRGLNSGLFLYYNSNNATDTFDPTVDQTGIFKIVHRTGLAQDYEGVVRMWKDEEVLPHPDPEWENNPDWTEDWNPRKVKVYIEVSWPIVKPYAERKKKTIAKDLFLSTNFGLMKKNQDCLTRGVLTNGHININPNNADMELWLDTATKWGLISIDTLKAWNRGNVVGPTELYGVAYKVCLLVKRGGDGSNTILIGGEGFNFDADYYVIQARKIYFRLIQSRSGNGSWELFITNSTRDAYINTCQDSCD